MKNYRKIFGRMIAAGGTRLLAAAAVLLALLALELLIPIGMNEMISRIEAEKNLHFFLISIALFLLAYLLICLFSYLNTKIYMQIGNRLLWSIRSQIYRVLWKSNYFTEVQKNKDKFKFVLANQSYTAFAIVVVYSLGGITNTLTAIAFLVIAFIYSIPVGCALCVSIGVTLAISFFTGKSILNGYEATTAAQEKDTAQIYETVDLAEVTRTNGLENYYLQKNQKIHNEFMNLSEKADSRAAFCEAVESGAHSLIYIVIAGILLMSDGVKGAEIVTLLFVTNMTLEISQRVQRQLQVIIKNIPVFENVVSQMEIPTKEGKQIRTISSIQFRNVAFEVENRNIFKDINFEIKQGQNVLIEGENGSGKSSVLKMLLGLYQPSSGDIRLNDVAIDDYDASSLYKAICYVSQDEMMLNENVQDYLSEITHRDVDHSIFNHLRNQVHLNSEIEKIEENGSLLSGGEKKKMMMLKCMLREDASVVILDEIDAGVDAETKVIWKQIEEDLKKDKTKIVLKISHIDPDTTGFDQVIQL